MMVTYLMVMAVIQNALLKLAIHVMEVLRIDLMYVKKYVEIA